MPTGSNWERPENLGRMVEYCGANISKDRLKGFMQAPWAPTVPDRRHYHLSALDIVIRAKKMFSRKESERSEFI